MRYEEINRCMFESLILWRAWTSLWNFSSRGRLVSILYNNNDYWKIEVAEEYWEKLSFSWHHWLYRFVRVLFELQNAPRSFHYSIQRVLQAVKYPLELEQLHDIFLSSRSRKEHFEMSQLYSAYWNRKSDYKPEGMLIIYQQTWLCQTWYCTRYTTKCFWHDGHN